MPAGYGEPILAMVLLSFSMTTEPANPRADAEEGLTLPVGLNPPQADEPSGPHVIRVSGQEDPFGIARTIISTRKNGVIVVCGYKGPGDFWHFDGHDASAVVAPALGMGRVAPTVDMDSPYGRIGVRDESKMHDAFRKHGISILPVSSVQILKTVQAEVDGHPPAASVPVQKVSIPEMGG